MKTFLTLIAGEGSAADLSEIWEPIKEYFDGICATCFAEMGSEEALYMEENKGAGHIIYLPYVGLHDIARNAALHCGKIEDDDIVVVTDVLERPSPTFCRDVSNLLAGQINTLFFFGKILAFRYHESLSYVGTPHELFNRFDGKMRFIDLAQGWGENKVNEALIRANVRPQKRPSNHWINHYGRYYISMPYGSNHCLLGNEHRGDPMTLYREREKTRIALREYLRGLGVPLTVEGFIRYMKQNPRDPNLIRFCNAEKITNDLYRVNVLGDTTVNDNHHWRDMVDLNKALDTAGQGG